MGGEEDGRGGEGRRMVGEEDGRAPEKVILNLPSNGIGYIGVNRLCHGVTNLFNVKKSRYHEEQGNK